MGTKLSEANEERNRTAEEWELLAELLALDAKREEAGPNVPSVFDSDCGGRRNLKNWTEVNHKAVLDLIRKTSMIEDDLGPLYNNLETIGRMLSGLIKFVENRKPGKRVEADVGGSVEE